MSATALLTLAAGLALLLVGAELLVRGASRLAVAMGLSPLVVGLTVVAFGTSSPELAVSLRGALGGAEGISLGNVLGSNVFNILLVLGVSALIAPLVVQQRLVRVEVPLLLVATLVVQLMALDNSISRVDGAILFGGAIAYTVYAVRTSRREAKEARAAERSRAPRSTAPRRGRALGLQVGFVVAGLALLVFGASWSVDGAVELARTFGLSERVIALTLIAAGTSLPEAATSVMASLRGQRDIAVGNAVGSCLFNLLAVLGPAALLSPAGIFASGDAVDFDLPVAFFVAFACLPVFFSGCRISRWEGALFTGYYVVYLTYLLLRGTRHPLLEPFAFAMWFIALPLTAITLLVLAFRTWQRRRER